MKDLWVLFLLVLASTRAFAGDLPGVYPVYSTYSDQTTHQRVTIKGAGTLIQDGDRYFVLTASHVSQGNLSSRIDINGKSVSLIRGFPMNLHDIEAIEIPPPGVAPLAKYDSVCDCFRATDQIKNWMTQGKLESSWRVMHMGGNPSTGSHDELLVPDWIGRPSLNDDARGVNIALEFGSADRRDSPVLSTDSGMQLYSYSTILRGMSGAPLFKVDGDRIELEGVAQSFQLFHKGTHFASAQAIKEVRKLYQSGGKPDLSGQGSWNFSQGVFYRSFADGTEEIRDPKKDRAGDILNVESGNGTTAEGGNGTTAEGGNAKTHSFRKTLPYGMIYQGKPIIGFSVVASDGKLHLLAPNLESLEFIRAHRDSICTFSGIPPETSIYDLLADRLDGQTSLDAVNLYRPDGRALSSADIMKSAEKRFPQVEGLFTHVTISDGNIKFHFIQTIPYSGNYILRNLRWIAGNYRTSKRSDFDVVLDRRGIPTGSKSSRFFPILDATNPETNDHYKIDIEKLIFEDPGVTSTELPKGKQMGGTYIPFHPPFPPVTVDPSLSKNYTQVPHLTIMRDRDGQESIVQFVGAGTFDWGNSLAQKCQIPRNDSNSFASPSPCEKHAAVEVSSQARNLSEGILKMLGGCKSWKNCGYPK